MKIKFLSKGAQMPSKETELSAGYDLFLPYDVYVPEGRSIIKLGFSIELDKGTGMFIFARSGVSAKGVNGFFADNDNERSRFDCDITLGLVDADYRGEVGILVNNHDMPFVLKKGDSIAQAVFLKVEAPLFEITNELSETKRGEQGFNLDKICYTCVYCVNTVNGVYCKAHRISKEYAGNVVCDSWSNIEVSDIGYSDKVIVLTGNID